MATVQALREVEKDLVQLADTYVDLQSLLDLAARAQGALAGASTEVELRTELGKFGGKKGELQAGMQLMKKLAAAERPKLGAVVNAIKLQVESDFDERCRAIERGALEA